MRSGKRPALVKGFCSETLRLFALAARSGARVRVRGPLLPRRRPLTPGGLSAADLSPLSRGEVKLSHVALALLTVGACTRSGEVLRASPTRAPVVLQVTDVRLSAGFGHACAVAAGTMHCWGDDGDGRLGVAHRRRRYRAGARDDCGRALDCAGRGQPSTPARWPADGGVWCWGGNANGQLGSGRLHVARRAPPGHAAGAGRGRAHGVRIHPARCWRTPASGAGATTSEGQLGPRRTGPRRGSPGADQLGSTPRDWMFVATGQGHGCGIRAPGRLVLLGPQHRTRSSVRGSPSRSRCAHPSRSARTPTGLRWAARNRRPVRAKRDGTLWRWGAQPSGALAIGDAAPPHARRGSRAYRDWSASDGRHVPHLRPAPRRRDWCAGRNTEGQIGGARLLDALPDMLRADPTAGWIEVRAGRFFTCARKADDSVWCMGDEHRARAGRSIPPRSTAAR